MNRINTILSLTLLLFFITGCSNSNINKEKKLEKQTINNFIEFSTQAYSSINKDNIQVNRADIYLNSSMEISYINANVWALEKQDNVNNYYGDGIVTCGDILPTIEQYRASLGSVNYNRIQETVLATEYADGPTWIGLHEFAEYLDRVNLKYFIKQNMSKPASFYQIFYGPELNVYSWIANPISNTKYFSYRNGKIQSRDKIEDIESGASGIKENQIMITIIPYYNTDIYENGIDTKVIGQPGKQFVANNILVLLIDR